MFGRYSAVIGFCTVHGLLANVACPGTGPGQLDAGEFGESERRAPIDSLSRRFGRIRERLRAQGYQEVGPPGRTYVMPQRGVARGMDLPRGRCTTIVALASTGVHDLVVELFDGDGSLLSTDAVDGEGGFAHVCPTRSSSGESRASTDVARSSSRGEDAARRTDAFYLVLRTREGSGAAMFGSFESALGHSKGLNALFSGVLTPKVPMRGVVRALSREHDALEGRGFTLVEGPQAGGLAEGESMRGVLPLTADDCYVARARGGIGVKDVDLFLFDAAGTEIARDVSGGAGAGLEHCPAVPGKHILEVRVFEGAGVVGWELFKRPARPRDKRFESSPAPGLKAGEKAGLLQKSAAELEARDYASRALLVEDAPIRAGEERGHEVLVERGCTVILGAADRRRTDLDLYLTSPEGKSVDRDTRVRPTAQVGVCVEESLVYRVVVKSYGQEGRYSLLAMQSPPEIRNIQTLRLEQASADVRRRGYAVSRRWLADLEQGERMVRRLDVAEGCFAVAAAGSESVRDVDLFLKDRKGELVASETGPVPWGALGHCVAEPSRFVLELRMYQGEGSVRVHQLASRKQERP